jgi:hypothetical protein
MYRSTFINGDVTCNLHRHAEFMFFQFNFKLDSRRTVGELGTNKCTNVRSNCLRLMKYLRIAISLYCTHCQFCNCTDIKFRVLDVLSRCKVIFGTSIQVPQAATRPGRYQLPVPSMMSALLGFSWFYLVLHANCRSTSPTLRPLPSTQFSVHNSLIMLTAALASHKTRNVLVT